MVRLRLFSCRRCISLIKRQVSFNFSKYTDKFAVQSRAGDRYTYNQLNALSFALHRIIESKFGSSSLRGKCVGILLPHDFMFTVAILASWLSGAIVIPLSTNYPPTYLNSLLDRSSVHIVITEKNLKDKISEELPRVLIDENLKAKSAILPDESFDFPKEQPALILHTSGSTGLPKGVVITHGNLHYQIMDMVNAWGWTPNDVILNVLPLNHIHGLVNCLLTPLSCGAACIFSEFSSKKVWRQLTSPIAKSPAVTVFMAVPTIYSRLSHEFIRMVGSLDRYSPFREFVHSVCKDQIRLFVSGSAPLTDKISKNWHFITNRNILERYGMTEAGMILSNTLDATTPGYVGFPLPSVEVRLVDSDGSILLHANEKSVTCYGDDPGNLTGLIQVKGPTVFSHYLNDETETRKSFTEDGWFITGDIAKYTTSGFQILGRESVDIIKFGGLKVSALNIERHLLDHDAIQDCAVLGIDDLTWGQKIAAVVALKPKARKPTLIEIRRWLGQRLPPHELPSMFKIIDNLTRTDVGKVNKKVLIKECFS